MFAANRGESLCVQNLFSILPAATSIQEIASRFPPGWEKDAPLHCGSQEDLWASEKADNARLIEIVDHPGKTRAASAEANVVIQYKTQ